MQAQLIQTRRAHTGGVRTLTALRGSQYFVSGGDDGLIYLWDLYSDSPQQTLSGHEAPLTVSAAFPERQFIASGDQDGKLLLWNVPTAEVVRALQPQDGPVTALTLSPDGTRLHSGYSSGDVYIHDAINGHLLAHYSSPQHIERVRGLVVSQNGDLIAARTQQPLAVWPPRPSDATSLNGVEPREFGDPLPEAAWLTLIENNSLLMQITPTGQLTLWDWRSGRALRDLTLRPDIQAVMLMPGERHLLVATRGPHLSVWSLITGTPLFNLDAPNADVTALAISRDGHHALVGCEEGSLHIYRLHLS